MWKGVARLLATGRHKSHETQRTYSDNNHNQTAADSNNDFTTPSIQITDAAPRSMPNLHHSELPVAHHHTRVEPQGPVSTSPTTSFPLMYALTKRWAWPAVAFRIQTHPHEVDATIVDDAGDTVLHWACFGHPPLEPIMALLSVCPELAAVPNVKGLLPLHVACSYRASSDVIRALVQAYPEGAKVKTRRGGSTPLHLLCDYGCSVDAIRAILETSAGLESVLLEDTTFCRKPLYILLARRNLAQFNRSVADLRSNLTRQRQPPTSNQNPATLNRPNGGARQPQPQRQPQQQQQQRLLGAEAPPASNWPDVVPPSLYEFWQKSALLVLAEHHVYRSSANSHPHGPLPPMDLLDDSCVLHACLGIPVCPPSLIEFALLLHPEQMLIPDDEGRLPLHIAASKLNQDPSAKSILLDLVTACPQAAQHRDVHQRIPLELCGASAWNESLARLVLAYPLGLAAMDFDDALYPRIWARVTQRRSGSGGTSTINNRETNHNVLFQLIREKPTILARCGSGL